MLGGPGRGYFQGAGFKGREADCSLQTTSMDQLPSFGFAGYSVSYNVWIGFGSFAINLYLPNMEP